MADYTWADGEVANATKLNAIQQQLNIICTSATRPTGTEGMLIYETDTNRAYRYDGSAWQLDGGAGLTSYTPTLTNITTGNGSVFGVYSIRPGSVRFWAKFTFGSTSSISNAPKFSLPITASSAPYDPDINARFVDSGTAAYQVLHNAATTTTTGFLYSAAASGSFVTIGSVNSTTPFTWTTNDYIEVTGEYRL